MFAIFLVAFVVFGILLNSHLLSTRVFSTAAIFNALDLIDQQDRQAILRTLIFVLDEDFPSPELLLAAKTRLQSLVNDNDTIIVDNDTAMSGTTREVEDSLIRELENYHDDQNTLNDSSRSSPQSIVYCRFATC